MRKIYLTLLLGLSLSFASAQISSPDSVCKGATVNFNPVPTAANYAWALDTIDISPTVLAGVKKLYVGGLGLGLPMGISMNQDGNGDYIAIVAQNQGGVLRLNYGSDPYGIPAVAILGTFGGKFTDTSHGVDVVNDNGNWYGFIANNKKLIRLDFGTSLSNAPTATVMNFTSGDMNYPYQFTMVRYNSGWVGFVANRGSNSITRFDFGTSITSTPTTYSLSGGFGTFSSPIGFSLYKEGANWFMIVANRGGGGGPGGSGSLTRIQFQSDLLTTTPTINNIGNPSNKLSNPRTVSIIADCNQMYALVTNENSHTVQVNFSGNSIMGSTSSVDLGKLNIDGSNISFITPFWFTGRLSFMGSSVDDSSLYILDNVYSLPTISAVNNSNVSFTQTLPNSGTYDVTMHADQGKACGPVASCKKLVVIGSINIAIKQYGNVLKATGSQCDVYVWKLNGVLLPGSTSDTVMPSGDGIYSVLGTKAGCASLSTYQYFASTNGIETLYGDAGINIYPNPSDGLFNIDLSGVDAQKATVTCYNMIGSVISNETLELQNGNKNIAVVNLNNFPKGIYQIKVNTNNGKKYTKQVTLQ
ncbi:MAG: T9SS type A sorting domain-containing protein [Bacteroidetes bacterium]|nr:T9SS type A sorting domain-containing protein [Bacteroidota bacterium]